jgi:hypothetical protein
VVAVVNARSLALCVLSIGCVELEIDPRKFPCDAGGPCLSPPAATPEPDAADAPVDAKVEEEDAAAGGFDDAETPADAGESIDAQPGDSGCFAGPSGRWELITTDIPRAGHTATLDPARSRALIFGGAPSTELVALSLGAAPAFTPLTVTGTRPPARADHAAFYEVGDEDLYLFFGFAPGLERLGDVWAYSIFDSSWREVDFNGEVPTPRNGVAIDGDAFLSGGCDSAGPNQDVWHFSTILETWLSRDTFDPPPRCDHTSTAVAIDAQIAFGGIGPNGPLGDTWLVEGIFLDATQLAVGRPAPSARFGHSTVIDPARNRLITFGGTDGEDAYGDLWALAIDQDPSRMCWSELAPEGPRPDPRAEHVAFFFGDRMYLYGGADGSDVFGDLWVLSFD